MTFYSWYIFCFVISFSSPIWFPINILTDRWERKRASQLINLATRHTRLPLDILFRRAFLGSTSAQRARVAQEPLLILTWGESTAIRYCFPEYVHCKEVVDSLVNENDWSVLAFLHFYLVSACAQYMYDITNSTISVALFVQSVYLSLILFNIIYFSIQLIFWTKMIK